MPIVLLFTLAILALVTMACQADLARVRIRIFNWIHWTRAVRVLEEHFERWVFCSRILSLVLAVVLFLFGVASALQW